MWPVWTMSDSSLTNTVCMGAYADPERLKKKKKKFVIIHQPILCYPLDTLCPHMDLTFGFSAPNNSFYSIVFYHLLHCYLKNNNNNLR